MANSRQGAYGISIEIVLDQVEHVYIDGYTDDNGELIATSEEREKFPRI